MSKMNKVQELKTLSIIGGGIGGCTTALEMAKTGKYKITIYEKQSELMRESSDATPGRMGLGFHYADKETAVYYLHATLEFTKKFGHFRQECDRVSSHPMRRGRYFIMKDSLVPKDDILKTYDAVKDEYASIIRRDASFQLFGPPDDFYRILQPHEYADDVQIEKVDIGIETAEELLGWASFRIFILNEIEKYSNFISIRTNTEVLAIQSVGRCSYLLQSKWGRETATTSHTDIIVNASWYNISKFNEMLGVPDVRRCNRVKAIATVQLPDDLFDAPCMFFCMGSFCMFSNKGNGIGMLTYSPETNLALSSSSDFEQEMWDTFFNVSDAEKTRKGEKIIAGVTKFIPKMKDAKLLKTGYGVIQTLMDEDTMDFGFQIGNLDFIHDPKTGGIYKRNYSGVSLGRAGYVVNSCMKLLYCFQNAELVRSFVEENIIEWKL
ncbi:uncharacterized protein LOC135491454 [Lineus longissimus]|uniref:uncharacterized protein LOC135491454 n=1 Tax=Lineus longissimus TaxID=88925 RepID=UPI00315CE64F